MAQRKETKKTIKVRDLKPKKDAKGGVVPKRQYHKSNTQTRQQNHHSINRRERTGNWVRNRTVEDRSLFGVPDTIKRQIQPQIRKE